MRMPVILKAGLNFRSPKRKTGMFVCDKFSGIDKQFKLQTNRKAITSTNSVSICNTLRNDVNKKICLMEQRKQYCGCYLDQFLPSPLLLLQQKSPQTVKYASFNYHTNVKLQFSLIYD